MRAPSYLLPSTHAEEISKSLTLRKNLGLTVTARGAGRSYNDASLNGGGIVLDMSAMDKILEWDLAPAWCDANLASLSSNCGRCVEPDGWWPPVVSGTMKTTSVAVSPRTSTAKIIFKRGPIGEHVMEFTAMLPTGEVNHLHPQTNADLFYAMISGLGMLGVFTSITLQMKRIHSGLIAVDAWPVPNLSRHLSDLA